MVLVTRVERIVGDGRNITSASSLRVSVGSTSTNASNAENDTNHNTNNGGSGEDGSDGDNGKSATIGIAASAGTVPAEEELALILSAVAAVHWDTEATTEGVANIVRAQIVVSASDVGVDTTKRPIADIVGAYALIIAEVSRNGSVGAS